MPIMDQSFSALLEDLEQRGLLDETLVAWVGEFGHTPKFNKNGGRDHWGHVFSVALAGAGIRGGQVVGKTTPDGMDVKDRPVKAADLFATALESIGIDYTSENHMGDRPIPVVDDGGSPVRELLG